MIIGLSLAAVIALFLIVGMASSDDDNDAPQVADNALDTSTAGDFTLIRNTALLSSPGGSTIKNLRLGRKVFVAGTLNGYAQVTDEDGAAGYVDWEAINGNPYLDQDYILVLENQCANRRRFVLFFRQNGTWRNNSSQVVDLNPYFSTPVSNDPNQNVMIDSLEMYYFPLNPNSPRPRISTISEREIRVNGRYEKMTAMIPRIQGNRAIVDFC